MTNICNYFNPCLDFHAVEDFKDLPYKEKAGIAFITTLIAYTVILIPLVVPVFRYLVEQWSDNPTSTPTIEKTQTVFGKTDPEYRQRVLTTKHPIESAPEDTQVSIEVWNPKEQQEDSGQVYKHLDIGSSNYGPESSRSEEYRHAASDSSGEKIHRALFHNLDHVIDTHPGYREFVFYLNDISFEGLDMAALNLAEHLRQKNKDKLLKIKIVKIVADVFKLNPLPTVDSASFIHPFDVFYGRIFFEHRLKPSNQLTKQKVTDLFLRVTSASKTGLLMKETNMSANMADTTIENTSKGITHQGLKFETADTSFIPPYTFPSGEEQQAYSVSYLVTRTTREKRNFLAMC